MRVLMIDGEALSIAEWARRTGVNRETIRTRLNTGWSEREAVFGRLGVRVLTGADGVIRPVKEWSQLLGIAESTLWNRKQRGLSDVECLLVGNYPRGRMSRVGN